MKAHKHTHNKDTQRHTHRHTHTRTYIPACLHTHKYLYTCILLFSTHPQISPHTGILLFNTPYIAIQHTHKYFYTCRDICGCAGCTDIQHTPTNISTRVICNSAHTHKYLYSGILQISKHPQICLHVYIAIKHTPTNMSTLCRLYTVYICTVMSCVCVYLYSNVCVCVYLYSNAEIFVGVSTRYIAIQQYSLLNSNS